MATAVSFPGANKIYRGPPGRDDVGDLHVFANGVCLVSAWDLNADELAEVIRTGRVFLSSFSGAVLFPVFVGSETTVRSVVVDYGAIWPKAVPS